jgi:hypothetical protein
MKWMGFADSRLIRACGVGASTIDAVPEAVMLEVDETVRELVGA